MCLIVSFTFMRMKGREKDIVIFSCVKTRPSIKFLSDHRRINVAITRAKRCVMIVGSTQVLRSDPMWKALVEYAMKSRRMKHVEKKQDGSYKFSIADV